MASAMQMRESGNGTTETRGGAGGTMELRVLGNDPAIETKIANFKLRAKALAKSQGATSIAFLRREEGRVVVLTAVPCRAEAPVAGLPVARKPEPAAPRAAAAIGGGERYVGYFAVRSELCLP